MLIDDIVNYCNSTFNSQDLTSVCKKCDHDCPGSCKGCLEEIHYPGRNPNGKRDYDCCNLINFYVCCYSFKYASEIWYLLRKSQSIQNINSYHIVSIGCGACPDLMAFESYLAEQNSGKRIQYWGIDVNNLWRPVHNRIESYRSLNITSAPMFKYEDAMEYFSHNNLKDANVLILQYVISHFYNNNSISEIGTFFSNLVDRIVVYKREGRPLVVMINDVNSNRRGRDYFKGLIDELSARGLGGTYSQYYFNYRIQNDFQRYGVMHEQNEVLYRIPNKMNSYDPWRECSSAQMLIEIK